MGTAVKASPPCTCLVATTLLRYTPDSAQHEGPSNEWPRLESAYPWVSPNVSGSMADDGARFRRRRGWMQQTARSRRGVRAASPRPMAVPGAHPRGGESLFRGSRRRWCPLGVDLARREARGACAVRLSERHEPSRRRSPQRHTADSLSRAAPRVPPGRAVHRQDQRYWAGPLRSLMGSGSTERVSLILVSENRCSAPLEAELRSIVATLESELGKRALSDARTGVCLFRSRAGGGGHTQRAASIAPSSHSGISRDDSRRALFELVKKGVWSVAPRFLETANGSRKAGSPPAMSWPKSRFTAHPRCS